jgi:hypothetical protein
VTGTDEFAAVLSPSWPAALRPQQYACPVDARPQAWVEPPSIIA